MVGSIALSSADSELRHAFISVGLGSPDLAPFSPILNLAKFLFLNKLPSWKNHYHPISNPHGYHHLISDEHCSYWFHKDGEKEPQSSEERCDYESWFWSQMPDKDPHATGLGWNDQQSKPFVYPEEMHATYWTGATTVRFLQQYDRPEPFS